MTSTVFHRSRQRIGRLLALMLFLAGTVLQPALGAMGALHEASERHPFDVHAVHDHPKVEAVGESASGATGLSTDASTDPLHVLLHYAHCCGSSGAWLVPALSVPASPAPKTGPLVALTHGVVHSHLRGPFRPPIAA